jgi:hypothetical protein
MQARMMPMTASVGGWTMAPQPARRPGQCHFRRTRHARAGQPGVGSLNSGDKPSSQYHQHCTDSCRDNPAGERVSDAKVNAHAI